MSYTYSITEATSKEIEKLRSLAEHWTIFCGAEPNAGGKIRKIFFGKFDSFKLSGLGRKDAFELARRVSAELNLSESDLRNICGKAKGNPLAIIELIEMTNAKGKVPSHHAGQKVLSATPFLSVALTMAIMARYGASSVSEPDAKIFAILFVLVVVLLMTFDRILKQKAK